MLPEPLLEPSRVIACQNIIQLSLGVHPLYETVEKLKDWGKQGQKLTLTLNADCPWASYLTVRGLLVLIYEDKIIMVLGTQ